MNYHKLPKIDLHCHLDGSLRPATIIDLAKQQKLTLPSNDIEQIRELMIAPETCESLDEYLLRFDLPISVMQTEEALERVSHELFVDAAQENVKYLEVRFGPQLHQQQGLSFKQIIGSVVKGMKRAESEYDIKGNYILSILRTWSKDNIYRLIDAGADFLNDGVVAFDLAGAELDGFCHEFIDYAAYAKQQGYRITIHAGEQGSGQNVWDAVELLGAERVGHGIHVQGHEAAYQSVKEKRIALENCPSSNVQTKAVPNITAHPFHDFYKDELLVTINTDNRTVSNTNMTEEVRKVMQTFALDEQDYFNIYTMSVQESFASLETKRDLLSYIQNWK